MEEDKLKKGCGCIIIIMALLFCIGLFQNDEEEQKGPQVMTVQKDCIGCVDVDAFNLYGQYAINRDSEGVMNLMLAGRAYIVQAGQECFVMQKNNVRAKIRVTVSGGKRVEVYVPTEFLK